ANPFLQQRSVLRNISNSALKAFLLSSEDPFDLKKTAAVLLARGLDLDALGYLLAHEDSRHVLSGLNLMSLRDNPDAVPTLQKLAKVINHSQALPILGQMAARYPEALIALVGDPDFDNPESVLRREVIPGIPLSGYKKTYRKDVKQALRQLAAI